MNQSRMSRLPLVVFAVMLIMALMASLSVLTPTQSVQAQVPSPTPEMEGEIVGGDVVTAGSYPWQVALIGAGSPAGDFWTGPNPDWQFCGGSLIHPTWVLTAAHCVVGETTSSVDVVAGVHNLLTPAAGFQRKDVVQIIIHSGYNAYTDNNDIALLELDSPVTIGGAGETATALVPLAQPYLGALVNYQSWVSGWGNTQYETPNYPYELHGVEVPIMSNAVCNNSAHYYRRITPGMLCAGYEGGGSDSCQGDSGGPLVIVNPNTAQVNLAGVVSWGIGCAGPRRPGVYARVSNYVGWVNTQIGIPRVTSIVRAETTPTSAQEVDYTVTFSESVSGVDAADFVTVTTGAITGAFISSVSPAGPASVYTVTVDTGLGNGTVRINVVDDNSIVDSDLYSLGGIATDDGKFTSAVTTIYTTTKTMSFRSTGAYDGYTIESAGFPGTGGAMNSTATFFMLGDNATNQAYRGQLHFATAGLPDTAVIDSAYLRLLRYALSGSDPFLSHGGLLLDYQQPFFGTAIGVENSDYEAAAITPGMPTLLTRSGEWYVLNVTMTATDINLTGNSQYRLRFATATDSDSIADLIRFYSGNMASVAYRPLLIINYHTP